MMKIVHICTALSGGASRATIRLHNALLNEGLDSSIVYLIGDEKRIPNAFKYETLKRKVNIIDRLLRAFHKRYLKKGGQQTLNWKVLRKIKAIATVDLFTFPVTGYRINELEIIHTADIIHLHWVANFLDWSSFFSKVKKPIIWTLHDRNIILGGLHLETDYFRNSDNLQKIDDTYRDIKAKSLTSCKIDLICPSPSLKKRIAKSKILSSNRIHVIPNSLNPEIFFPLDRSDSRKELGFLDDDIIITFVGNISHHKGFDLLFEAIKLFNNNKVNFVVLGIDRAELSKEEFPENVHFLGYIKKDSQLSTIYSASSSIIITSREENLPNVMLESWFCGTPVLSVPVGGMSDYIIPEFNGLISNEISAESIKEMIKDFVDNKINNFNSEEIISKARVVFSQGSQAKALIEVYKRAIS